MIKKKSEQKVEVRKNMRAGSGEVSIRHYFNQEEINVPCRLCAELVLPKGAGIGAHQHVNEDEIFIIQKGRALIIDDGKEIEVIEGDAILTGKGASHAIKNIGNEDLIVTAIIIQYGQKGV